MTNVRRIAETAAVILLTAAYALAQLPKDPEERAKVLAQVMQANARQLTLFDRDGKQLNSFAQRDLYNQPAFSPDSKRIAVIKNDLENHVGALGLSIPTVVFGRNFRTRSVGSTEWIVVQFPWMVEVLSVKVSLAPNEKASQMNPHLPHACAVEV